MSDPGGSFSLLVFLIPLSRPRDFGNACVYESLAFCVLPERCNSTEALGNRAVLYQAEVFAMLVELIEGVNCLPVRIRRVDGSCEPRIEGAERILNGQW